MPTTTIRIEDELKDRLATAAQLSGQTAHAFILQAIAQSVEQVEIDAEFNQRADARWARVLASGKAVAWDEAKSYLQARASGDKPRRPAGRRIATAKT
jgi:predicted transcriptional regulator